MMNAFRNWAENSASRRSRTGEGLVERAEAAAAVADARVERLNFLALDLPPSGLPSGRRVLEMQGVGFAWPGAPDVLSGVDLVVTGPERIGLTGPNGAGKSTLLRLASGELAPTAGQVRLSVAAARLDQDASLPAGSASLVEAFRRMNPLASENRARAALATFLFRNTAADKPPAALSGGEKLRAALACRLMGDDPPALLVLDEPTNHLDLDSVEALEAALRRYDGALLVASHDADFLDALNLTRRLELSGE
jgi:ATPase subunit of ABC transporter with duplicated ATPase domains